MDFFSNIFSANPTPYQPANATEIVVETASNTTPEVSLSDQFSAWSSNLFKPAPVKPVQKDFSYVKHIGEIPPTCEKAEPKVFSRQNLRDQVFDDEWEAFELLKKTEISQHFSDDFLMACLFSKKLDVPRVEGLLKKNLEWRTENGFVDLPSWDSLNKELFLSSFAMKIPGARTKDGEGIVYITMRNLLPRNHAPFIDKAISWVVWHGMQGSLWEDMDYFRNGIVVIADLTDMGWDNLDLENATKMGSSFIDNFPMRLSKIVFIRPPWIISTILDAFSLFMKKKLMERIIHVEDPNVILEFVEPSQLHTTFGGTLEYSIPDWFQFIEAQHEAMKSSEQSVQIESI